MNFIPLFILRRKREGENEANDYLPLNRAYKVSPTKIYELPHCTVEGQLVYPSEDNHAHEHAALVSKLRVNPSDVVQMTQKKLRCHLNNIEPT